MNISIRTTDLKKAISNVAKAASKRSPMAALEGIAFKTAENTVTLTAYNMELGITTNVPATVKMGGETVLNAKLLQEIVSKLSGEEINISDDGNIATIEAGDSVYQIPAMKYADFSEPPVVNAKSENIISIEASVLKEMIVRTIYAVADNDTRPVLTGSYFEIEENRLRIVSVDGFRIVYVTKALTSKSNPTTGFIVPGKSLTEIVKLLNGDGDVTISFTKRHVCFVTNEVTIVTRLIEGDFIEYKNAIPAETTMTVKVDPKDVVGACERMGLLINDGIKNPVKCTFANNSIHFECATAIGKVQDTISAEIEFDGSKDEMTVGFNNNYLKDAFSRLGADEVQIKLKTPVNAAIVTTGDTEEFLALILPVRLS